MADFDHELSSYIQARTTSDQKEKEENAAANAAADALFGVAFPHPHPEGFHPTHEAPAFAQHPVTQMWHDATTGTFSYYDPASETYVPVEGPVSGSGSGSGAGIGTGVGAGAGSDIYPSVQDNNGYYIDPITGYAVDMSGYGREGQTHYDAPPESDATLRLCVISSNILKVGGVIMMDASGLSFGRDRPLSGQGKRVRMVEMEISRFHASIYLDRQQVSQEDRNHEDTVSSSADGSGQVAETNDGNEFRSNDATSATATPISPNSAGPTTLGSLEMNEEQTTAAVTDPHNETPQGEVVEEESAEETNRQGNADEKEEGEYDESSDAGARDMTYEQPNGKSDGDEERETEEQQRYREYQRQMEEYQQYYQHAAPTTYVDSFQITDCGSTHGTFLNGERLSAPKTASQPFALKHLDRLQLGSTVFEIHAHEEGRICGMCQVTDGNEIEVLDDKEREESVVKSSPTWSGPSRLEMERERIEEMNRLKKKWAGPDKTTIPSKRAVERRDSPSAGGGGGGSPRGYVDRAAKRRLHNPDRSSPVPSVTPIYPSQEVSSGFHVPVAKTNKGHAMLSKMGWKAGMGLGAAGQGVVEPVQLMVTENKAGLGSGALQTQGAAAAASSRLPETPGEVARRKARERYAQLK
ncbi:hypothetical protein BC939DRAFT_497086 [Gamsiella multidivaricata]|uniref:uncharacterized protein n=1 Tax=Gamsiella multidivaricata TaxID=101098 RepID=UPI00222073EB|nr:uncharacterized protein BC939DRAFT_497086 [Gamsiella multidivaricata]KAI7816874.1 hypothetical protein BC939DRAFT_497086 [Gamsiella multidivaricata]